MTKNQIIYTARIMIIDDEDHNVALLKDILASEGFSEVTGCQDPLQAVELFSVKNFDLVLLDIMMPNLNGFQVLEKFRLARPDHNIPIVVITALDHREVRLRALRGDGADFLTKPIDEDEVLARVINLLENRFLKKNLEKLVKERTADLEATKLEVLQRLGQAAEFKDNETGMHVKRMARYSALLAREVGWDEGACEMLLQAAPMHDIGKIGTPDRVLLKPGKLDAEEWEEMKRHVDIGGKIFSNGKTPLIEMAREVVMNHHEKWDGSGYPEGKTGQDTPIAGRIVAVADVFDALTSQRPYKKAWTVDDALAELERCAGSHFDPELIPKFLKIVPEILAVMKRFIG
ncbi:MAG: response regulator [Magnetococcales bacterium]|nr:response regulator [Magnetococcales bacterium]